jgi:hypothetical protein
MDQSVGVMDADRAGSGGGEVEQPMMFKKFAVDFCAPKNDRLRLVAN